MYGSISGHYNPFLGIFSPFVEILLGFPLSYFLNLSPDWHCNFMDSDDGVVGVLYVSEDLFFVMWFA